MRSSIINTSPDIITNAELFLGMATSGSVCMIVGIIIGYLIWHKDDFWAKHNQIIAERAARQAVKRSKASGIGWDTRIANAKAKSTKA